jgi:hypothetical protein
MPAQSSTLPAPVGGWNARDSIAEMDPKDAVVLTNWFPRTTDVMLRNGYTTWATGLGGQVNTIMAYGGGTAAGDKLFAAVGGNIFDVTAGGAVGAAVVTGNASDKWQYANVATTGSNKYIMAADGVDLPLLYSGSVWTNPSITGVTNTLLNNPQVHKNRVWFIESASLRAWYLPVQSIGGAANSLDMSAYAQLGGYLMAVATWTVDAGYGIDDMLVFITSKGEVIVWGGTDPSSASTWQLAGVFRIGSPVGARCFYKYGADLLCICRDGVVPMSKEFLSGRIDPRIAISFKIEQAVSDAISTAGSNFGWQLLYFPLENQLWLNVPFSGAQQQYVMNTITGGWCNYMGWNASCFELWQDKPYLGLNGTVGLAWNSFLDAGSNIAGQGMQAFGYFDAPGNLKRFLMARPIFALGGPANIACAVNVDFNRTIPNAPSAPSGSFSVGDWDVTLWDQCIWGGQSTLANWIGITGVGYSAAPAISINSPGTQANWEATTITYETGAIL